MATTQSTQEAVNARVSGSNIHPAATTVIVVGRTPRTFKTKSLEELLEKAAKAQRLAAVLGSTQAYELEATYDIKNEEWTGQFSRVW